jgi:KDO2-lipid IV(A) lauroyltransferase
MKDKIAYILFFAFVKVIQASPKWAISLINSVFYHLIWHLDFFRKKIVLRNLEIAFPNLTQKERLHIAKKTYKNYIYYLSEMIKNINISKEELNKKVSLIRENYLLEAINSKKPIIFMTAHFGNWELVPKVIGANYTPMVVLMREFDNKKIGEIFKKSRNSFNISTLNKDASIKGILKALKEGKSLAILIDQHTYQTNAIKVDFFNQRVKFNRSITTLSEKFNAIVVPMFSYQKDGKYFLEFQKPKSFSKEDTIESFTQWQASTIEEMIKKHPSEYYWFHKRFKEIPNIYN